MLLFLTYIADYLLLSPQPSVRKQHNAGYKHKANVRIYYQQYEAQQNQYLIDQKVKEHLGQAAAYQQVGAAYNQLRPRLPVLPTPMMPMPGNPQMAPLMPGMRPAPLPRPMLGGYVPAPGMPPMAMPPGAPSMPGQLNGIPRPVTMSAPPMAPGSSATPTSGALPMFTPAMYQANTQPAAPTSGGFDSSNMTTAQAPDANH